MPFKTKLLILLGSLSTLLTMARSGLIESFGMGFWGPNGHDAVWHLAVINQIKEGFPVQNPVYSGSFLTNYHIGYDFIVASISRLGLSPIDLYFRILPFLIAILLGYLTYRYTKSNLSVFLIYFASSFGWLYTFLKDGQIAGESLFWAMQASSTQLNPPYALSLVFLLIALLILDKKPILSGVFFAIATSIKVYAGLLSLAGLVLLLIVKREKNILKTVIIHSIISVIILYYYGAFSGNNIIQLNPLWFTRSLINAIDKFYFPQLATLHGNLLQNPFTYKFPVLVSIEIFAIILFIVGNFGVRILSLKSLIQKNKNNSDFVIKVIIIIGILVPIFFTQKGTAWNTIQFMYYAIFFSCFYLAKNLPKSKILVVVLLAVGCIGSYGTIKDYLGFPPPTAITQDELNALSFLKSQQGEIILTYPYDKFVKDTYKKTPIPIHAYETTSYVSAFTSKKVFLEDTVNLTIIDKSYSSREDDIKKFFKENDKFFNRGLLVNNKIDYIYLTSNQNLSSSLEDLQVDKVYEKQQIRIYKVRR